MKKIIITTLLLALTASAQDTLVLDEAFKLALKNNHNIRMAGNTTEMSENSATLGNAGLLPSVNVTAGMVYNDIDGGNTPGQTTSPSDKLGLSVTLFNGLSGLNNYKSLKNQLESTRLQEQLLIENTLLNVAQAYFTLSAARENLTNLGEQLEISGERLELAADKTAIGNQGRLEFLSAQVDFNSDSIAYLEAQQTYGDARRNLNVLLGRSPEKDLAVESYHQDFPDFDRLELQSLAEQNNSSYKLTGNAVTAAALSLKSAKGSFLPSITYGAGYSNSQTNKDIDLALDDPATTLQHSLTFAWRLYGGGTRNTAVKNARLSLENAELEKELQQLELSRDIQSYHSAYTNSLASLAADENTLEYARLNYERSKELFRLGQISSLEYREAQLSLSQTKLRITQSRYSARIYELMLLQLSGQLL